MFKFLLLCIALLCLPVPAGAQIDPQSLVGVWEGSWSRRTERAQLTGPAVVTISKVEGGKVYGKTESMGSRENPTYSWAADVTPTGYTFVIGQGPAKGHATTATVEGTTMRIVTGIGGSTSIVLSKKQ